MNLGLIEPNLTLTRGTADVSFALYAVALALMLRNSKSARWLWTAACIVFVFHVIAAFQMVHHWSHREAFDETARQTEALFGFNWGGGLYFNYAVLVVWFGDVGWWWLNSASYETRRRWIGWSLHAFLAFMWFNGAVVFGKGWIRWGGLVAFVVLAVLAVQRKFKHRSD